MLNVHLAQPCAREGRSMPADEHVPARLAWTPTLPDLEQNQHAFVDGITHFLAIYGVLACPFLALMQSCCCRASRHSLHSLQ